MIALTFIDFFSPIILVIFIYAILYGIFQWAKFLGDNKVLHAVIAIVAAIFVAILSPGASTMVRFMIPWFTVLGIFIVLAIMLYKIFGATDSQIKDVVAKPMVYWTVFIIIIIMVLGALSQAFGQRQLELTTGETQNMTGVDINRPEDLEAGTGSFNQNLAATFYHPKVLGMILLFIVGALTVSTLARPVVKG
jgi:hypothetical protein